MALVCAYFFISHTSVLVIFGSRTLIVCHPTKLAGIELYLQFLYPLYANRVVRRESLSAQTESRSARRDLRLAIGC